MHPAGRFARLTGLVERRYALLLEAVLVLGALCRIGVGFDLAANDPEHHSIPLDSKVYLEWAGEIAAGDLLGEKPFFLNPLYAYFLAPVVLAAPVSPLPLLRLVQGALGLAAVLLVAAATRRLLSKTAAIAAALLAALCPVLLFYEQVPMIVTLAVFLNALSLFLLARFAARRTAGAAAAAGIPLGFAVLARPNVGLFVLLLPLWMLRLAPAGRRLRFAATRTAALAGVAALVVLPVTVRNLAVGGDLVAVTSSMGVNLWQSNNPEAWRTGRMHSKEIRFHPRLIEADSLRMAEEAEDRPLSPSEASAWWTRKTLRAVAAEPGRAARFALRKALLFLGPREEPSSYNLPMLLEETVFLGLLPARSAVLGPLALLGLLVVLARRREALPFALLFLTYLVGLTIFFPLAHYRAPVLPATLPLAAMGLLALLEPALDGRPRALVGPALALVAAALLANAVPIADAISPGEAARRPEDLAVTWFNRGLSLLEVNDTEGAREAFETARRVEPESWLPDLGLAHLARHRGDLETEGRLLASVLRRTDDATVIARYARNRFDLGRREEGIALGRRAAAADPGVPLVRGTLAGMLLEAGRPAEALPELRAEERAGAATSTGRLGQVWCLRVLGRTDQAWTLLADSLSRFPREGALRFERAYLLLSRGAPPAEIGAAVRAGRDLGDPVPDDLRRYLGE